MGYVSKMVRKHVHENRHRTRGRRSSPRTDCSAPLRVSALSCGDVARRHPLAPRRRVMAHRGAFAGGIALRAPRVVSHRPGRTWLTTSVALPRHRPLRAAVPPAQMAAPACRRTPMIGSVVQRVLGVHTSCSKGAFGDADVPRVPPRSCAGDRHVLLPQEGSPRGAASAYRVRGGARKPVLWQQRCEAEGGMP
jgi:hypothetical protein